MMENGFPAILIQACHNSIDLTDKPAFIIGFAFRNGIGLSFVQTKRKVDV